MGENHAERPRELDDCGAQHKGREVLLPRTPAQREADPPRRPLTEAEEEGVHAHAIHAEEPVGDEVGAHDHRLKGEIVRSRRDLAAAKSAKPRSLGRAEETC